MCIFPPFREPTCCLPINQFREAVVVDKYIARINVVMRQAYSVTRAVNFFGNLSQTRLRSNNENEMKDPEQRRKIVIQTL